VTDQPALVGFTREEITYDGVGGAVLDGQINDPWVSAATSTHGSTKAYLTGTADKRSRLALSSGGWRRTEVQTTFDSYGLPSQVNDLGDTSTSGDEECNRTTYARDTTPWMINYVVRAERVGVACSVTASYPGDVISDVRTFYDGSTTFATAPTKGNVTLTQEVASYSGSTPSYVQSTRATYDIYGRTLDKYDALDRKTTIAFTPTTGGPTTATTITNALGHVVTTTLEPAWGEAIATVDANSRRSDMTFDPLGRLTAVWLPDKSKADGESANLKFSYLVLTNAPNVVTTQSLRDDGGYDLAYALYDGRLRPRQTQEPASGGGMVITDTFYDSRGLVTKANGAYWNAGTAGTTLVTVTDNTVPAQTVKVYDGDERETAQILLSYGTEKWRTTTSYGGDRVNVTPPAGGTATTTITDAGGQTTELRQYAAATPTGSYDATRYTYTKGGDQATVTDPAGNAWKYTYDVRGRKVSDTDPDKGTSSYTYDNADQVLTTTDARGTTLAYTYDLLGRKTGEYSGSTSGTQLAAWTYDTLASGTVVKGQPATSTRYVNGNAYTSAVTNYDSRYRSLGTTVTIPAAEGNLAGTYKANTGYTDTGLPLLVTYPAAGGLAAETLRYSYDGDGRLQTAQSGLSTLLTAATYSPYDEPLQYTLQSVAGKQVAQTFFYDDATRQLTRSVVDRTVSPTHLADVNYTYDAAGNVTKIADTPVGGTADTQCFGYDYLRRLTSAWTATNACATAPATAILGGPAPYWQSWTYDKTGNRLSETNYNTSTGAGVTSAYTYPAAGATRPHALSTVATSGVTNSYSYDADGNAIGRTIAGSAQTLTWDAEGHLAKVVEGSKTSEFLYDADGNRLIRRDPDAVTLYLGATELKLTKSTSAVSATRYYKVGSVTAVRTSAGLTFEAADRLGTAQLSINATDLTAVQRRYLPFGELRGTAPTWPTEKGYVAGTVDSSTGLTHLGAREYDADTGRFISVDPIIDFSSPQQMNAYSYANNTPLTLSDPSGLEPGSWCNTSSCIQKDNDRRKEKPKKRKKSKDPGRGRSGCDDCETGSGYYDTPLRKGYTDVEDRRIAAEKRRLAREYAAKKAREAAALKARLAQALKQQKWDACAAKMGPNRTAMCGKSPANAGQPKENPVTLLWKHVFLTWSLCLPGSHSCVKTKFQQGKVSFIGAVTTSPATPGIGSLFPTLGYSHRDPAVHPRESKSTSGSIGRYGIGFGQNEKGTAWSDWDISVGTNFKEGGWLGTENSGIKMFGLSWSQGLGSWCPDSHCY